MRGKDYKLPDDSVITETGMLIAETCDLPAKAQFLNFMQYNGLYSCPNCKQRGETFEHSTGVDLTYFDSTQNPFLQKGEKWTPSTSKRVLILSFFILSPTNMMFNKNFLKITYKKN